MTREIRNRHAQDLLSVKNRRLGIALGLLAASIYSGYILAYYF